MCVCDICLPGIAHIAKPQCLKSAVSVASTAEATCCAVWTFLVRVCLAARIVSRTIALLYIAQIEMQIHKHNIISYSTCGSQLTAQLRLTATFAMAGQPQPLAGLQSMRMDNSCFRFLWAHTMAIFGHARVSKNCDVGYLQQARRSPIATRPPWQGRSEQRLTMMLGMMLYHEPSKFTRRAQPPSFFLNTNVSL